MISFGLIGDGSFGSRVRSVLENEPNIYLSWVATTKDCQNELLKVDWVYICSSNECHYENALAFMKKGCSVIIEKPPTLSATAAEFLIEKACEHDVHIYFSNIYLFDNQVTQIESPRTFLWQKQIKKPTSDSAFTALLFHHIYIFIKNIDNTNINKLIVKKIHFNSPEDFSFELRNSKYLAKFKYFRSADAISCHQINNTIIEPGKPKTLSTMLDFILKKSNLDQNHKLTLHVLKIMESVRSLIFPKKVVIGAGIFGCTSAISLSNKGYNVDLIERNSDIMMEASSINQYRIHRGYHYPRSDETVKQCSNSFSVFESKYSEAIVSNSSLTNSYYAIASHNSKVNSKEYINFLNRHKLNYNIVDIGLNDVSLTVQVSEKLYDPHKLKNIVAMRLSAMGVNLLLNKNANKNVLDDYSGGVIATYANQGYWDKKKINYQFELCEKPIARLPNRYKGISIVIMDGPFMCIDPYSDTDLHVMGNVVHAIHNTSFGDRPEIPEEYKDLLNKGCIKPPPHLTKFTSFIKSASKFFPEINQSEHIGSMYTIRAVESNRDHDDARLTTLNELDKNFYKIFSGKVCTSVETANKVTQLISDAKK